MGKLMLTGIVIASLGVGMMGWGLHSESSREYMGKSLFSSRESADNTMKRINGKKAEVETEMISSEDSEYATRDLKIFGWGIGVFSLGALLSFAGCRGGYTGVHPWDEKEEDIGGGKRRRDKLYGSPNSGPQYNPEIGRRVRWKI